MKTRSAVLVGLVITLSAFAPPPGVAQTSGSGSALNFDGTNGYVRVPSGVWFNGHFTVEGWVYVRSYNSWSRLIDFGNGQWIHNVYLALSEGGTGYPKMGIFNAGNEPLIASSQQLPLNQWSHLAATFNGALARIYINGNLVGSGSAPVPPNVTRTNNYIGRSNWGADGYANALFDEVRIWNIARSQAQIAATMHNRAQGTEANLMGYWRFNENTGTQAADTSAHSAPATLVGGVTWAQSTAPVSGVSVLNHWRMGDNDPGATPGATNTQAIDSAGSRHLTMSGPALYSTNVAASALPETRSSLSVDFTTAQAYGLQTVVSTAQDNFGVEAWVKPASAASGQTIVYNGNTATSGWGLTIGPSGYSALFGGRVGFGSAAVTPNLWTHVALVRDNGVSTLYVNGVASGTAPDFPNVPAGNFALAVPPQNPAVQNFIGVMDEVRVFTVTPGQFTTNDLLLPRLKVSTLAASGVTSNSATFNGIVDPGGVNALAFFRYGTTANYGQVGETFAISANSAAVAPQTVVTGLLSATRYHFQLVATNAFSVYLSEDRSFRTEGSLAVTTLADNGPGSLRDALANADDGATITFATNGTITLTGGELLITNSVTIAGPGATNLALSGNQLSRVFNIATTNASVTISGITVRDGRAPGHGGGIHNVGTLVITDCAITGNQAGTGSPGAPGGTGGPGAGGGGVFNSGSISLIRCTFSQNRGGNGGRGGEGYVALFVPIPGGPGGIGGFGGAILNVGDALVRQCTISSNLGGAGGIGGGPFAGLPPGANGPAGPAGGVHNNGTLTIIASTLTENTSGNTAGGIHNISQAAVTMLNTIVAGNSSPSSPDLSGACTSLGHNLIGQTNGVAGLTNAVSGDLFGSAAIPLDPGLVPLSDNGGPTRTHRLLAGSPALDAGDDALLNTPYNLVTDQRGFSRKIGPHVDIGAIESEVVWPPPSAVTLQVTPNQDPIFGIWSASLRGTVNPGGAQTVTWFQFGQTTAYGGTASAGTLALLNTNDNLVTATISNLVDSRTYHYRVVASNAVGIFYGADRTFSTTPIQPTAGDLNGDGIVDRSELNIVQSNYFLTSPWLQMTNTAGLGGTNVTFALSDATNRAFTVEFSTDLSLWQPLGAATPRFEFTDTNALALPQRYYRLRYP